ncbi:MAG: hypothetical protein JWR24_1250 [Actinoallomurus sp.]|nr:hypothetical protein [Actinoallomurus sp.]
MKMLLAVSTAVAAGVLAVPATANATAKLPVCRASFTGHPENSSPPWATDTFTRTTKFHKNDDGTYKVHITDRGHFTTIPGTKSDSGDTIANKVTGVFTGSGDYTVTSATGPTCVTGESYTATHDARTSDWPKHYFGDSATTTGIDPWSWLYRTCREYMVEDSVKGTVGHIAGKPCKAKPTPTPTDSTPEPSPSDSTPAPSDTTTTPPTSAPAPTPVKSDLPVTG